MRYFYTIFSSIAAICLFFGTTAVAQEAQMTSPNESKVQIPNVYFELDNGLSVFLLKDNSLPIITANLWINVGSTDERPGRTGFAHLFEHLMFMGTKLVPDIDVLLETGGGSNNASTREDVTNYYTVAPENMLETVLFIESDRLANLASAMTQEKLDKQRDVVLNERKQVLENQPYGKMWLDMPSVLYPPDHPYGHPVIGSVEDITSATLEDVIDFFNTYYVPSNTTLILAGDFEEARAKALITQYFGAIAKKPKPAQVEIAQLSKPQKQRHILYDDVQVPRLVLLWHSPAFLSTGDAELDILSSILCKGKNSRLINKLVYEKQMASSISCSQVSANASVFMIDAMPLPGTSIDELEAEIVAELGKVLEDGISNEEFGRTKLGIETAYVMHLQSISSRADAFNSYYFYAHTADFPAADLKRYREASPQSLMLKAREVFSDEARRASLIILPKENATL